MLYLKYNTRQSYLFFCTNLAKGSFFTRKGMTSMYLQSSYLPFPVILPTFSRNPKFADRYDVSLIAPGSIVGLYARQNGLVERFNMQQKAAG